MNAATRLKSSPPPPARPISGERILELKTYQATLAGEIEALRDARADLDARILRLERLQSDAFGEVRTIRPRLLVVPEETGAVSMSTAIQAVLGQYPAGLTAVEISRRVHQVKPDVRIASIIAEVYALAHRRTLKATGSPATFTLA